MATRTVVQITPNTLTLGGRHNAFYSFYRWETGERRFAEHMCLTGRGRGRWRSSKPQLLPLREADTGLGVGAPWEPTQAHCSHFLPFR